MGENNGNPNLVCEKKISGTSASYSEVDEYIQTPCSDVEDNSLEYWKINNEKDPRLATLCEKYLSVPAI